MKIKLDPFNASFASYVISIVIIVAALLLYQESVKLVGALPPYIFFYPAVIITALLGGFGPGILATAAAALLAAYWILPPYGFAVSSLPDIVGMVIFSFSSILICVVALLYRRARQKAADYAADLVHHEERKKADEALRKSQEQFHTLADSIPNLAWWANGDGYITWYNHRWYEYTGTTPEQMEGWGWQSVHDPKVLPEVLEQWKRSIATGQPFEMEFPLRGADGVFRPFLTRVLPLKDQAGQVLRWFGTNTDISALKQAGEALEERTKQLEDTNKELESFSYSVSHDLRAPLRAIDGYSRMILRQQGDKFDENTKHQFDVIRQNVKMMGQLIDDLLTLSHLGRQELSMSRLNMEDLHRDVWEELKAANPDKPIDMKISNVPPGMGDRSLIKQVLINLLSNAIKFTRIREVPFVEFGGYVTETENVYYIRDNGVGFDMQYHGKLFGVFQRLHNAAEYEGTGVGLSIVQRIINRHGGRVWAESEPDKGATFYFSLRRIG